MQLRNLYGGFSECQLSVESFDLGEGIMLSQTFAHLTAPFIMTFAPPGPEGFIPLHGVQPRVALALIYTFRFTYPPIFKDRTG